MKNFKFKQIHNIKVNENASNVVSTVQAVHFHLFSL